MPPPRTPIRMSIFELLKAGPGPSSSHTIAPMRAGADFARLTAALPDTILRRARGVRVRLLGSLSATGRGHGTDRAVLAGLMGHEPDSCPPALLADLPRLPAHERVLRAGELRLPLEDGIIDFGPVHHDAPYSNTLHIDLLDVPWPPPARPFHPPPPPHADAAHHIDASHPGAASGPASELASERTSGPGDRTAEAAFLTLPPYDHNADFPDPLERRILFSREYYSVGGGFLQWKGWTAPEHGTPRHPYANMRELQVRLVESGLALDALMLENETAVTGASPAGIREELDALLRLMLDTVRRGCETRGVLPGGIRLARKAPVLFERAASLEDFDRRLCLLNAYAYAAAEENAAGHMIVTAPTCGAAGVVPAIAMFMREHLHLEMAALRRGLLAATAVGFIAKQNAGIAGAEVGCQGEIGVASAMAAAMLALAGGYSARVVENAAEIALEHHLGLTCDPVGGYVQIPCIERNAVGAVKAYNACLIARNENPASHMVSYDDALRAMAEIGRDMNAKYKETSTGGLAVCLVAC